MEETLSDRLRIAMKGRSPEVVAAQAGVDRQTLRRALGGRKRGLFTDTIQAIAGACGVAPGWLAFGEAGARHGG